MIEIYKIVTHNTFNNAYFTNRDETWVIKKDKQFKYEETAKKYIKEMSKQRTDMINFAGEFLNNKEALDEFAEQFCFTNDIYMPYRRFFIGKPNLKKIKESLTKQGINVKKFIQE